MGSLSNAPISEQWKRAADDWADKDDAARLLEDSKSSVFSEMVNTVKAGDPNLSDTAAEKLVRATPEWRDFSRSITRARTVANKAKIECEFLKMKYGEWNNAEANHRAGARL
jgi:hypothetical protein